MLFSNRKFIFLCCVAVLSASFVLHTIVRHEVVGHYSWFGGRGEWESGTDWLFSLIVCIGIIVGGAQAVRRTLPVVVAAGTAASTACLFLMYADLPSFVVGVLSLITAFSLGVCGYPLLLAIVGTVVPPRRRLTGLMAPIAVALLVEAVLWPSPLRIGHLAANSSALLLIVVCGLLLIGVLTLKPAYETAAREDPVERPTLARAIAEFVANANFWALSASLFVLGLHTEYVAAYLIDARFAADSNQISRETQTTAMIGLIAFFGLIAAGLFGHLVAAKRAVGWLHALCVLAVVVFVFVPLRYPSVITLVTTIAMAWLSIGLFVACMAANIFGTRYLGLLFSLFYFAHYLGQRTSSVLTDLSESTFGSANTVWYFIIIVGIIVAYYIYGINENRPNIVQKTIRKNIILQDD